MTKRKPFTLPTSWHAEPYPSHWSFAYEANTARREDYDFRVEFGKGVPQSEQISVIALLEAAPKLLAAIQHVLIASEDGGDMHDIDWQMLRTAIAEAEGRPA